MKKTIAFVLTWVCVLGLAGCGERTNERSEAFNTVKDDFYNAVPVEVNDNIIQNCKSYAENFAYETGELNKAVLLGEDWIDAVYCEDDIKQEMIDAKDVVVIFEGIRCVVDADTEIVLGRIPYV